MQQTTTTACPCGSGKLHSACHGLANSTAHRFADGELHFTAQILASFSQLPGFVEANQRAVEEIAGGDSSGFGLLLFDSEIGEALGVMVQEHFMIDRRMPSGRTIASEFTATKPRLSRGQRRALKAYSRSHVAVYQVEATAQGGSTTLRDQITGARLTTHLDLESNPTIGTLILARFLPDSRDTWRAASAILPIPHSMNTDIQSALDDGLRTADPDTPPAIIYRNLFTRLLNVWLASFHGTAIELCNNFDGERVELADLVYEVADPEALRRSLDTHTELERADHHRPGSDLVWRFPRPEPELRSASLGHLILHGDSLRFEAMSRARAERMRRWLARNVTSGLRLRERVLIGEEQIEELIQATATASVRAALTANLRRSLDEPNPAFDLQSVRAAAGDPCYYEIVILWLESLPTIFADTPLCAGMDGGEFWEELGFADEWARRTSAD